MPSIPSRLFEFELKNRHLMRFQLRRRTNIDWSTSIDQLRAEVEKGAGFFGKLPADFELSPVQIDGLTAEWMRGAV